ncbi:hypothetical protein [Nocardiopsis trehalosi]|uniref:hypothetical protein n=1 Tax=Nocardiopsis trehalosi TaxID=109329 RepID=UPI0008344D10|nr:hypothetical protein [Nocardiopsis trehalosi]
MRFLRYARFLVREGLPRAMYSTAVLAVLLLAVTAWPLFAPLADLLPLPDPLPWEHIRSVAVNAVILAIALAVIRSRRRAPFRLGWLILAAWIAAAAAVAAIVALTWAALGSPPLDAPQRLSPRALDAIATRAFAIVAGLGGVAFLVIGYRRQRATEADAVREDVRLFSERFTAAAEQLGSEQPAVRLAGVHALARLADDAPAGRDDLVQTVIDVLCSYLRMPYEPAPGPLPSDASPDQIADHRRRERDFAASREVRHTTIRAVANGLRTSRRWRGKDYDFRGAVFDGGDFSRAVFEDGSVLFDGAEFAHGTVLFSRAQFSTTLVGFGRARFTGGAVVFFRTRFFHSSIGAYYSTFEGDGTLSFENTEFTRGVLDFHDAAIGDGVVFTDATLSGTEVSFENATGKRPAGLLMMVADGKPTSLVMPDSWWPEGMRAAGT